VNVLDLFSGIGCGGRVMNEVAKRMRLAAQLIDPAVGNIPPRLFIEGANEIDALAARLAEEQDEVELKDACIKGMEAQADLMRSRLSAEIQSHKETTARYIQAASQRDAAWSRLAEAEKSRDQWQEETFQQIKNRDYWKAQYDEKQIRLAEAERDIEFKDACIKRLDEIAAQSVKRLAEAEALLREIYSYAEDQGMETLMDMIDATDSADGGEK
jgi:hypothetical protein